MQRVSSSTCKFIAVLAFPALAGCSQAADSPDAAVLKQVLEKKLISLKPAGHTERQVLFEEVRAGKPAGGSYPFQVTASVRDYGPGYPANRFYGETCVGRMEKWPFHLSRDAFGDWQVQGRMTITDGRQCKPNPGPGISSIPLDSLKGSPAPKSGNASQANVKPQRAAAAMSQGDARTGAYECWQFSSPRLGLNFTLQPGGRYLDSELKRGTYTYERTGGKVTFKGGALDNQSAFYHEPGGKPTVSFRNAQGREIVFCEIAKG